MTTKRLYLFLLTLLTALPVYSGDLRLALTDVNNDRGHLLIIVASTEEGLMSPSMDLSLYDALITLKARQGSMSVHLPDFPPGRYAISVLHDENHNGGMDLATDRLPAEGYGFSNSVGRFTTPSFSDAVFVHKDDQVTQQSIQLIYIGRD